MKKRERMTLGMGWRLIALAALVVALGLGVHPTPGWAVVNCTTVLAIAETGVDSDNDGFTDLQECTGIATAGASSITFPWCGSSALLSRDQCVDPDSKDLFVIYAPATSGSLLPVDFAPFGSVTACPTASSCITFSGLSALGVTVHQLTTAQAALNRTVSSVSAQKAVRVAESLDDGTILGNCQFGTPLDLDGCVVYTQRAKNFIDTTCDSAGDTTTDRNQVFLAYVTYLSIHETGHSVGGLAAEYNARFGGNHYKAGSGIVMEQAATYSTKAHTCTWYISSGWNATLDPPAVKLK